MKQSDITPPIIEKCKQIAEHWRMEIYEGCWVVWENGKIELTKTGGDIIRIKAYPDECYIPIPSISDVLGKLREKYKLLPHNWKDDLEEGFYNVLNSHISVSIFHEWLLTALLEVLREGKDE